MEMDKPACRACLATDKILFTLRDKQLLAAFQELLGTKIPLSKNLPGHLCFICRHKINTYMSFKKSCMQAQILVKKHIETIGLSDEYLKVLHSFCKNINLSISEVDIICYDSNEITKNIEHEFQDSFDDSFEPKDDLEDITEYSADVQTIKESKEDLKDITEYSSDVQFIKEPKDGLKDVTENSSDVQTIKEPNDLIKDENDLNLLFDEITDFDVDDNDNGNDFSVYQENALNANVHFEDLNIEGEIYYNHVNEVVKKIENDHDYFGKNGNTTKQHNELSETKTLPPKSVSKGLEVKIGNKTFTLVPNQQENLVSKPPSKNNIEDIIVRDNETGTLKHDVSRQTNKSKSSKAKHYSLKLQAVHSLNLQQKMKKYNMQFRLLNKKEQIEKFETRKDTASYKNAQYKCNLCYKGIATESVYKAHMVLHQPNATRTFECPICHLFMTKRYRKRHVQTHEYQFTCLTCGDDSVNMSYIRSHYNQHQKLEYKCRKCNKVFRSRAALSNHIQKNYATMVCSICEHKVIKGMTVHMAHRHPQAASCVKCGLMFNDKNAVEKHFPKCTGTTDNTETRFCQYCGEDYENGDFFEQHLKIHRTENNYRREFDKLRCAKEKEKQLKIKSGAVTVEERKKYHKRKYKKNLRLRPEMCEVCGKICSNKYALATHMRFHTNDRPYKCPHCPRACYTPAQYKSHLLIHTGEKPFKCDLCPKRFRQQPHLSAHKRSVHTGETYSCELCLKSFSFSSNLRTHVRAVHLGEQVRAPRSRKKKDVVAE